nr:MAG TPA_asm: hypothetical protein [Caudoviricetes sp.]
MTFCFPSTHSNTASNHTQNTQDIYFNEYP